MRAGFTLIETLVAVLILGFLLVGLSGGARFGVNAALRQARAGDRSGDLDALDRALRQVVSSADPAAPLAGTPGRMTLAAFVPSATGLQDVALGLRNDRLVLRYGRRPPGLSLGPPSIAEAELVGGLRAISLSYYAPPDADHPLPQWRPSWSGPGLPQLVRLRLTFTDSSATGWPDIVVATQRTR